MISEGLSKEVISGQWRGDSHVKSCRGGLLRGNGQSKGPEARVGHRQKASVCRAHRSNGEGLSGPRGQHVAPAGSVRSFTSSFCNQTSPGDLFSILTEGTEDKGKDTY